MTHHMSIVRVSMFYWGWKSLLFIVKFIFYGNVFYYFNPPTQPLREHFTKQRTPTEDIFRDLLRNSLFFPVILASIYEIPYCFNILSTTICVCLLQNANKCSCYSVKSSVTTIVVQIWNNGSNLNGLVETKESLRTHCHTPIAKFFSTHLCLALRR